MNRLFKEYEIGDFFDEMFAAPEMVRRHYQRLARALLGDEHAEFGSQKNPGGEILP